MGMNQSTVGMWKNNSLINLHLLTGQIGKPGAGPFSLTGQPNAMGGGKQGFVPSIAGLSARRKRKPSSQSGRVLGPHTWKYSGSPGIIGDRDVPRSGTRHAQGNLDCSNQACRQHARSAPDSEGTRTARNSSSYRMPIILPRQHNTLMSCCLLPSGVRRTGPAPTAREWSLSAPNYGMLPASRCPTPKSSVASQRKWAIPGSITHRVPTSGMSSFN